MVRWRRIPAQLTIALSVVLLGASPAAADDSSGAPTPLAFGVTAYADTSSYGVESGEQNTTAPFGNQCGQSYNVGVARSAWYAVQGTGGPISVTTSGFDTALFVYAGSPAGSFVTCNDDTPLGIHSAASFASADGTTYAIQVGRACNEGPESPCAQSPSSGTLAMRVDGTPSVAPGPVSGPDPGPETGSSSPSLPHNQLAPSIGGLVVAGQLLTCANGEWAGAAPLTYKADWLRDGTTVANGARYRVIARDVGRQLVCRVTATNPFGSASASSQPMKAIRTRASVVLIVTSGGIDKPPGKSAAKFCRGTVAIRLYRGGRVIARHAVLMRRDCGFSWKFQLTRGQVGNARRLLFRWRFSGNDDAYPVSYANYARVPRARRR